MIDQERFTIPFGRNDYCGPVALAYLTRTNPDVAAAALRAVCGRQAIRGIESVFMIIAMTRQGYKAYSASKPYSWIETKEMFRDWLKSHCSDAEYLVNITGHYIVVHNGLYFDNHCHLGKTLDCCPYLRRRVVKAWRIVKP
jgi:hypothetical protein